MLRGQLRGRLYHVSEPNLVLLVQISVGLFFFITLLLSLLPLLFFQEPGTTNLVNMAYTSGTWQRQELVSVAEY